ncbi:MAG: IS1182 family transposase [Chloroflexi bacterium]|nr:IS1182 family transposase [Chloroflexota bacterium]
MFRTYDQSQPFLLPPSLRDFVDEGHPAHLINDLVDLLDLTMLEARYGSLGQPAYHPRLMLKVTLYGFTVGIFSSRKLQRACQENLAFKYLAGMETPAFKTFIEFRQRHRDDMKAVFVQTAKLARELGFARLGAVALDGTKVEIDALLDQAKAADAREDREYGPDADGYRVSEELARREQRLKKIKEAKAALEQREREDHPGAPIDPDKQVSFADHDARCFTKPGDGTRYVYNAQAAVDMDSQIIVANHIEDSVSDAHAAGPALAGMEQDLGALPRELVTDAGYGNKDTLERCQERGVTPVSATAREGKEGHAGKLDRFSYDGGLDRFACPHGQVFVFVREHASDGTRTYRTADPVPCTCGHYETADGREVIRVGPGHLAKRVLRRIMDEPGRRELYRRRKCTVEPSFGQIKAGMGFRRFFYRGLRNVRGEWDLVCAAFNLRKLAALLANTSGHANAAGPIRRRGARGTSALGPHSVRMALLPDIRDALLHHFIRPATLSVGRLAHAA